MAPQNISSPFTPGWAGRDLISWKKYIVETFNNNPFYCLSVSSGNILLEYLLAAEPKKIMAAVSFIGVPSGRDPRFDCPVLYILGERDPTVPFEARRRQLAMAAERKNIRIVSYPDEGHGIRDPDNMVDLIEKIICLYNKSGSN